MHRLDSVGSFGAEALEEDDGKERITDDYHRRNDDHNDQLCAAIAIVAVLAPLRFLPVKTDDHRQEY